MKTIATTLYPFVPSGPQFQTALEFFAALGFEKQWQQAGLAGLRFGGAYFLLQDIDVPEWQTNQMITYEVADLDGYWAELDAERIANRFPGVRFKPPTDFPWGGKCTSSIPAGFVGTFARRERVSPDDTASLTTFRWPRSIGTRRNTHSPGR